MDIIEQLAEARNTSVQVDEKSMAELRQKFDPIKEGLEGMPFFSRIAFKQNQQSFDDETSKKLKMIDAREVVAIINMFNIEKFDSVNHPVRPILQGQDAGIIWMIRNPIENMSISCLNISISMIRLRWNLLPHSTKLEEDMAVKNIRDIKTALSSVQQSLVFMISTTRFPMVLPLRGSFSLFSRL